MVFLFALLVVAVLAVVGVAEVFEELVVAGAVVVELVKHPVVDLNFDLS